MIATKHTPGIYCLLTISVIFLLQACKPKHETQHIEDGVAINHIDTSKIVVDANLVDWNDKYYLNSLTNPWGVEDYDSTIFNYNIVDDHFNFYFKTIDSSYTVEPFVNEMSVAAGDRVELFFSPNKEIDEYYCFEISPEGDVLDYKAKFYRKFDNAWDFESLQLATNISGNTYIVEGRISLDELKSLGMDTLMYMGIFRADYLAKDSMNWYTKSIPQSETPDFHISTAFEKIVME